MKLTEVLSGLGRTVAYYPGLARIVGVKECVLLCQFIYWHDKSQTADGWVYKTRDDIETETGLSHEEQATARKKLKGMGLWEEQNQRWDHKMMYRVNMEALNALWEESESARRRETGNHGVAKPGTTVSVYSNTRVPQDDAAPSECFPEELRSEDFMTAWKKWEGHLADHRKRVGVVQRDQLWRQCIETGVERSVAVLKACIDAGYKRIVWDVKIEAPPRTADPQKLTAEEKALLAAGVPLENLRK